MIIIIISSYQMDPSLVIIIIIVVVIIIRVFITQPLVQLEEQPIIKGELIIMVH